MILHPHSPLWSELRRTSPPHDGRRHPRRVRRRGHRHRSVPVAGSPSQLEDSPCSHFPRTESFHRGLLCGAGGGILRFQLKLTRGCMPCGGSAIEPLPVLCTGPSTPRLIALLNTPLSPVVFEVLKTDLEHDWAFTRSPPFSPSALTSTLTSALTSARPRTNANPPPFRPPTQT